MGGLTVPGSVTGKRREPEPTSPERSRPRASEEFPPFHEWFRDFLRDELRPYPGRTLLALRYTLAATLTMLAIVTFRIPGAAVGGFFCLLLPRDSPKATLKSGVSLLITFTVALAFVYVGTLLFIDYPLTHFLWVAGSFFLGFYSLSVISNYAAASAFTILIVVAVPQWDLSAPTALIVVENLWVAGSVAVAVAATLLVESVFALFRTEDQLRSGLGERLTAVAMFFETQGQEESRNKVQQLATVGVSRLRNLALSSNESAHEVARLSTAVALTGRLVDLVAATEQVRESDPARRAALALELRTLSVVLDGTRKQPLPPIKRSQAEADPLLLELETTAETLRVVLTHEADDSLTVDAVTPRAAPFFVPDAWSNPEHLRFGLRGCLAALACYVVMNAVDWPGLSTSLFTCVVTALTSVGSSRQKQVLRITGALTGSVLIGLTGQVLILPMLDTVAGFTAYFAVVVFIASWFITSSPRLSYFGVQVALGFFLVNLGTPYPQTSLAVSRNNIAGILLGLFVMWLVFDKLGSKPAAQVMAEVFSTNLTLMGNLATPWPRGNAADLAEIRTLREKISQNFNSVNAQADGVLFESGKQRRRSLQVRSVLLSAQPVMRTMFLVEIATLQHRVPVAPRDLPASLLQAQIAFDISLRDFFEQLAAMLRARATGDEAVATPSLAPLSAAQDELRSGVGDAYGDHPTARSQAVLALVAHLVKSAQLLSHELSELPAVQD